MYSATYIGLVLAVCGRGTSLFARLRGGFGATSGREAATGRNQELLVLPTKFTHRGGYG